MLALGAERGMTVTRDGDGFDEPSLPGVGGCAAIAPSIVSMSERKGREAPYKCVTR